MANDAKPLSEPHEMLCEAHRATIDAQAAQIAFLTDGKAEQQMAAALGVDDGRTWTLAGLQEVARNRVAKIAELEAHHAHAIDEWSRAEGRIKELEAKLGDRQDEVSDSRLLLTRAVEAMRRVPHLYQQIGVTEKGVRICPNSPSEIAAVHVAVQCARLGGACAFTKLIEEIEHAG